MNGTVARGIPCLAIFAMLSLSTAQAEIKIGIAGPLSGNTLAVGEQQEVGANSAINHLNENGGVAGEEIVATSVDDACDPEQAKAAAKQLVAEEVVFVVGHVCSGASLAAAKIYQDAGIVMISPASTNPQVTEQGFANVFRVIGRDDQQGVIAGDLIADKFASARIAILSDGEAYGLGLAEFTRKQLHKRGVTEALFEAFKREQPDYKQLVDKLVAEKIDVVYAGGYVGDIAIIARQAKTALPSLQLISGDAMANAEFTVIAGEAGKGTLFTFGPDVRLNPGAKTVVAAIREADAYEPEGYTLYAYAAVQAWAQAVEAAGSSKADAVIAALRSKTFDTALGKIGFDDKGDVTGISSFVWYEFNEETYVQVQ